MSHEALASDWNAFHTTEKQRGEWAPGNERPSRSQLLDKQRDPHPILNALMDEALRRLLLTADGAVMRLKWARARSAADEGFGPSSDLAQIIDRLGERFTACKTHRKRLSVIKEAQDEADRLRPVDRSRVRGTRAWRDRIAYDQRSCESLAVAYGVSESTVNRIKRSAGTIKQRGRPKKVAGLNLLT